MPGSQLGPTQVLHIDANRGSAARSSRPKNSPRMAPKTRPGNGPALVLPPPPEIKPIVFPEDRRVSERKSMEQQAREYVLYVLITTGYLPKMELLLKVDPKFAAAIMAETRRIAAKAALEIEERRATERRIMEKLQAEREARRRRLLQTLGGILQLAAERAGMDLAHLEVYLGTPDFVIDAGSERGLSDAKLLLETNYPELSTEQIRDLPLDRFVDLVLRCDLLSSSCGATSELLDAVTSLNGVPGPMVPTTIEGLISVLELAARTNPRYWCCRISREPHSFFIEYRSGEVRVYQSYLSKYTLAFSVKDLKPHSFRNFITLLETTMEVNDRAAKLKLFSAEPHWRSTQITYRLNLSPVDAETIIQNVLGLLVRNAPQWQAVRRRTMRELAPSAPLSPIAATSEVSSRPHLPPEYNLAPDEVSYFMDLDSDQEGAAKRGELPPGDYVSFYDGSVTYTLLRFDPVSGKYKFRKKG